MGREQSTYASSVIIFGAGGQAADAFEVASSMGLHVEGFVDETLDGTQSRRYFNRPVFSAVDSASGAPGFDLLFVAIGEGWLREQATLKLRNSRDSWKMASLIHPSATVSPTATVGEGSIVFAGASIGPSVSIGRGAIIGANVTVGHDCVIGDYASVFAGVSIGGHARIGVRSVVGLNAAIREKVTIGNDALIGAQSFIRENVVDRCVVMGIPGVKVRDRSPDEPYLL